MASFPRIPWFRQNRPGLYSLGPNVIWVLLHDMKFRITSFDMIESSPCILFLPMYFLVSTQKNKINFQILQWNPYLDYWRGKDTITFLLWKVCNRLKLHLCKCSFSLWKKGFFKIDFFVCFFYTRHFVSLGERRLLIWGNR